MTSIPASRKARAMTFAPRSWLSRPGLAMRIRIGWFIIISLPAKVGITSCRLPGLPLPVFAEDLFQRSKNFPDGGIVFHGLLDGHHQVVLVAFRFGRGLPDGRQRCGQFGGIPPALEFLKLL